MQFIIDDLVANIEMLSTHRYGCRVVQRAVEHCGAAQKNVVLENIVSCLDSLIVDHYGENIAALSLHTYWAVIVVVGFSQLWSLNSSLSLSFFLQAITLSN
jgi:hypothetical protein